MSQLRQTLTTLFLFGLASLVPLSAQVDQGRITGVVHDPTGAALRGATVTISNERTAEQRTAATNDQGFYSFVALQPSLYTVRAKATNFSEQEVKGVRLVVGQEFHQDFTLAVHTSTEVITVEATTPEVDTSSARMGINVDPRAVSQLPINGRQLSQLALQAPGAVNSGSGTFNDLRFSGRANQENAIRYDGVEGSAIIDASPGNLNGQIPSPFKLQASLENVQEFRVESNNYPAEFGTGTGGQVSVVTKSGSNLFRGSVFEYFRDDALDAPNYFDSTRRNDGSVIEELPKSALSQHQFGGSFGG